MLNMPLKAYIRGRSVLSSAWQWPAVRTILGAGEKPTDGLVPSTQIVMRMFFRPN